MKKKVDIIGRAELIEIPDIGDQLIPAKVDTGADISSIWTSKVVEKADGLHCVFFEPGSRYYTGKPVVFAKNYSITRIANSFGHKELRYKVKLSIRVRGKLIRATFTLSDRSQKTYPVLLGRRLLQSKFMVDVSQGQPLKKLEKSKAQRLNKDLKRLTKRKEE